MKVGDRIGNFELVKQPAIGGFGVVFLGTHVQMGQRVAVKVLHRQWSADKDHVQRFFNEARAATRIDDPSIVKILDCGFMGEDAYLILEYLSGETLSARLHRERLHPQRTVTLGRQIARALSRAHRVGIIHRDLKPDNIFVVADEEVPGGERIKILDFGIAKLGEATASVQRTATRMVFGTPAYMAPEQCRSASKVDLRADIYSLGCILFEMVCGRPPFMGETGELIGKQQYVEPPRPRDLAPDVAPALEAVIAKALIKDPSLRHQTMAELASELQSLTRPDTGSVLPNREAHDQPVHPQLGPTLPPRTTLSSTASEQVAPRAQPRRVNKLVVAAVAISMTVIGFAASQHGRSRRGAAPKRLPSSAAAPTNLVEAAPHVVPLSAGPALVPPAATKPMPADQEASASPDRFTGEVRPLPAVAKRVPPTATTVGAEEANDTSQATCDEVQCAIDPSMPCCKRLGRAPGSRARHEVAVGEDSVTLTADRARSALRNVEKRLLACREYLYGADGDVEVKIVVNGEGSASSVIAVGTFAGTNVGRCVEDAVKSANFWSWAGSTIAIHVPLGANR